MKMNNQNYLKKNSIKLNKNYMKRIKENQMNFNKDWKRIYK